MERNKHLVSERVKIWGTHCKERGLGELDTHIEGKLDKETVMYLVSLHKLIAE